MRERSLFVATALALWLLYFVQALWSPILLDDWFQLRYWRDHELSFAALWEYGHHNYFHYNPRIGDVFLAIVDGSRVVHLIVTPIVQLALVPIVFVIAFARWPRPTLRDLQLLVFLQVMIWLVIPIPGILYFYRPFATNYLWGFTLTLALFVPYRLALARAHDHRRRLWLVPLLFVLGWIAGMCNEHTGPTAMLAIAALVFVAYRRRQLQIWMVAGMIGLYIGYPMLFFAPGQSVRYAGLATRATPLRLLVERGFTGCVDIVFNFIGSSWLGIMLFLAAFASYAIRRRASPAVPRDTWYLLAAAFAIICTLFLSPTASDRVFFASGVLLVGAFAVVVERIYRDRDVRRLVVGGCVALALYHGARFVDTGLELDAATDERLALLRAADPGSVAVVPSHAHPDRSRWYLGDDFVQHPWLRDYVGGELYDLAGVDLDRPEKHPRVRYVPARSYDPTLATLPLLLDTPTYREWLAKPEARARVARQIDPQLQRLTVRVTGLPFEDRRRRPIVAYEWTRSGFAVVDGRPYDDTRGHFIRIEPSTIPPDVESTWIVGCKLTSSVRPFDDGERVLLPVDERACRGPFTALMCQRDRCWVAGWY